MTATRRRFLQSTAPLGAAAMDERRQDDLSEKR